MDDDTIRLGDVVRTPRGDVARVSSFYGDKANSANLETVDGTDFVGYCRVSQLEKVDSASSSDEAGDD